MMELLCVSVVKAKRWEKEPNVFVYVLVIVQLQITIFHVLYKETS
jgi:hypothetical protein